MTPRSSYRWMIIAILQLIIAIWLWQLALPISGSLRSHLFLAGLASATLGSYSVARGLCERTRL